ncbi:hypothetical protein QBC44DRAFT_328074 [Cladorrhinum sp. PSN332]|nr:hypothetical protein QBC44DRAFT_328074 [Cladorrhinum sp. PSN332]
MVAASLLISIFRLTGNVVQAVTQVAKIKIKKAKVKMGSGYDISQYLLDRANIFDTASKVPLFYDLRNLSGLLNEVFAPEIYIDYTSLLGGEPFTIASSEWIEKMAKILENFSASQHVTCGIVTNLPQPGGTRPTTVTIRAQVSGSLVGHPSADGATGLSQNGGLLEAQLQHFPDLEAQSLNPWRITKYKVVKSWEKGDKAVIQQAEKDFK